MECAAACLHIVGYAVILRGLVKHDSIHRKPRALWSSSRNLIWCNLLTMPVLRDLAYYQNPRSTKTRLVRTSGPLPVPQTASFSEVPLYLVKASKITRTSPGLLTLMIGWWGSNHIFPAMIRFASSGDNFLKCPSSMYSLKVLAYFMTRSGSSLSLGLESCSDFCYCSKNL